ncbi:MAG TPA: protein kinase [Kofleriaceae bacterium]
MGVELEDTQQAPAGIDSDRTATRDAHPGPARAREPGLSAGKQLGHFRIDRPLGAGGMGEVYLATDLALDRPVAIKVLPEEVARDPRRRDRMIREARAQARVTHPNVGHIYFIGEDSDRLYFAMEYVAGETLTDLIAKGPLSCEAALGVIRGAALGLREAQRHGFTHRDVKPSNLMIDSHGVLKVLDFGLAAGDSGGAPDGPVAQTSLGGTPLYMAPEQARGEAVDHRADIYALGATLYHLVAGKPPFEADSVDELFSLHATAARPAVPRTNRPRIQIRAVDALCSKMMAADPEQRFASYDELLRAIELASVEQMRPAGFWARGIAMLLDLTLVGIVVSIGEAIAANIRGDGGVRTTMPIVIPVLAIYTALCVARWGRTAGKALIELEVAAIDTGKKPTLARSIRRSIALFGVPIALSVFDLVFDFTDMKLGADLAGVATFLSMLGGVLLLLYASLRMSAKRTIWDRASGTVVRYRRGSS